MAVSSSLISVVLICSIAVQRFGASERLETGLWITSLALGLLLGLLFYSRFRRWNVPLNVFEVGLGGTYLLIGISTLVSRQKLSMPNSALVIAGLGLLIPLILLMAQHITSGAILLRVDEALGHSYRYISHVGTVVGVTLVIAVFWSRIVSYRNLTLAVAVAVLVFVISGYITRIRQVRLPTKVLGPLLAMVFALAAWDLTPAWDEHHQLFFLAPANEIRLGRLMLTDTYSQYGVGLYYFLAAAFEVIGIGYGSLVFLTGGLAAVGVLLVYVILKLATNSTTYALFGTSAALVVGPLAASVPVSQQPSLGFFRFGPTWVLVLVLTVVLSQRAPSRIWLVLSAVTLSLSVVWSVESAFYSLGIYFIVAVCGPALIGERALARTFAAYALAAISLLCVAIATLTFTFSGSWPSLQIYLKYVQLYALQDSYGFPVEHWSPGILMHLGVIASHVAIGAILVSRSTTPSQLRQDVFPLLAISTFAVLAYTYYLGRSSPNNLNSVSAPFVVMTVLWLHRLHSSQQQSREVFRRLALCIGIFGITLIGVGNVDALKNKLPKSALWSLFHEPSDPGSFRSKTSYLLGNPVLDGRFPTVEKLISENVSEDTPVLLIVDSNLMVEASMRMNRANLVPLSNPDQQGMLSNEILRITDAVANIPCDSIALIQRTAHDNDQAGDLLRQLNSFVREKYQLSTVAEDGDFGLERLQCATTS